MIPYVLLASTVGLGIGYVGLKNDWNLLATWVFAASAGTWVTLAALLL